MENNIVDVRVKYFNETYKSAMRNLNRYYNYLNELDDKISRIVDILDVVLSSEIQLALANNGGTALDSIKLIDEHLKTYNEQIKDIEKRITKYRWKLEPYFELAQQPSIDYYTLLNEIQILINIYKPLLEEKLETCGKYFIELDNEF